MHRLSLCACVVFLSAGTVSYGSVTSCQTPEEVQVGQTGTINCSFPESIPRYKKFIVVRPGPSSTDEERIVNCYNINGVHECDVARGYDLKYTTGPLQIVVIPNVTKQHEGTYICQLIPSDPKDCKSCYLKVKEARIFDNGDSDDNETPNQTGSNHTSTLPPGAIAGIVVGALIAFAVAVAVVVVKKCKQSRCKKRGRAANLTVITGGALTWSEKGGRAPCKLTTIEGGFASSEKRGLTPCISPTTEGDDTSSHSSQGSTTPLVKDSMLTVYNFTHEKT